jgi:CRP-like cAMP-binding protein
VRRHREAVAALRAVPLWASLPEARLLEVARAMRAVDVRPGTAVVSQGDPGGRFYLIASGLFEVQVDDSPTARLLPGAYFGERALLDQAPHQASIVALVPSRVYALEASVFHATLAHDVDTRARLDAALAYRAQVAAMPLFRDLSPTELDLLLTRLVPRGVEAGDELIQEGAPDDRFYVVRDGSVEVVRGGVRLAVLGPGEPFGEIAPRLHVLRTASVSALERTHLLMLDGADLRDLLAGYCGLGDDLQRVGHSRLEAQLAADDNPGFDAAPAPMPIPTMLIPQGASPTL